MVKLSMDAPNSADKKTCSTVKNIPNITKLPNCLYACCLCVSYGLILLIVYV